MKIDNSVLKKLCQLAHLKISPEEESVLQTQLTEILSHFENIAQIDTKDVPPLTSPLNQKLSLREDTPQEFKERETFLQESAHQENQLFKVPPVV